jgi:hypothetical protein
MPHDPLKDKEQMLTEKLKRLNSGEITANYLHASDNSRQEETIARTEAQLREVKRALAKGEPQKQLPTGADIHAETNKPMPPKTKPAAPAKEGK